MRVCHRGLAGFMRVCCWNQAHFVIAIISSRKIRDVENGVANANRALHREFWHFRLSLSLSLWCLKVFPFHSRLRKTCSGKDLLIWWNYWPLGRMEMWISPKHFILDTMGHGWSRIVYLLSLQTRWQSENIRVKSEQQLLYPWMVRGTNLSTKPIFDQKHLQTHNSWHKEIPLWDAWSQKECLLLFHLRAT